MKRRTSEETAKSFRDSYFRPARFKDACTKCHNGNHSRRNCQGIPEAVVIGQGRLVPTPQEWVYLERLFPGIYGDWIIFIAEPIENYQLQLEGRPVAALAVHRKYLKSFVYRNSQWEQL